jgi:F-type H+-transporting ATPase subunit b
MDPTLQKLAELLIKALPTILIFVALTFYLRAIFFKPLMAVMDERRRQTEGARELAKQAFDAADQKTAAFERALQTARLELQKEQEAARQRWLAEQSEAVASARAAADARLKQARAEIAEETERLKAQLAGDAGSLADEIITRLLERRAA